jgi:hypothetical protein
MVHSMRRSQRDSVNVTGMALLTVLTAALLAVLTSPLLTLIQGRSLKRMLGQFGMNPAGMNTTVYEPNRYKPTHVKPKSITRFETNSEVCW